MVLHCTGSQACPLRHVRNSSISTNQTHFLLKLCLVKRWACHQHNPAVWASVCRHSVSGWAEETLGADTGLEVKDEPRCDRRFGLPLQLPARDLASVTIFCFLSVFSLPSSSSLPSSFNLLNGFPDSTFTCLMLHKCHLYIFLARHWWPDFQKLHGDICGVSGMALQVFIPTAAGTPHQRHTGGAVDVLHLWRVLLHHLHQLLYGPAEAAAPHLLEHQYCGFCCAVYAWQG